MADFKVIETQEDFDAAIQKRLAQKEREVSAAYKNYMAPEDVEQLKASHKKEIDAINQQLAAAKETAAGHDQIVADLTARASKAEAALLKNRIANESGIPLELADRLIGESEAELKADAEKMAGYMRPHAAPPLRSTDPNGKAFGSYDPKDAGYMELLNQLTTPR